MRSAVYPRVVGVSLGVLPLCPYWIFGNFKHFRGGFDSDLGQTRSPGAAALAPAFDGSCACRTPPALIGPVPFADLQAMIRKAETALEAFTPEEVNSWAGKDLNLKIGPRKLAFTSETLILSFSLPNFYFHAVTAYDILRTRGVPLGKRDYEGQLRTRTA